MEPVQITIQVEAQEAVGSLNAATGALTDFLAALKAISTQVGRAAAPLNTLSKNLMGMDNAIQSMNKIMQEFADNLNSVSGSLEKTGNSVKSSIFPFEKMETLLLTISNAITEMSASTKQLVASVEQIGKSFISLSENGQVTINVLKNYANTTNIVQGGNNKFIEGLGKTKNAMQGSMKDISGYSNMIGSLYFSYIKVATTAYAFMAALRGISTLLTPAIEFQQSILKTAAVANASSSEIQNLTNTVFQLGETSLLSVNDIAQATYVLASMGLNIKQIKESLGPIVLFAQGSGFDLESAAMAVATAIKSFGLSFGDAAHVVDVFQEAVTKSLIFGQDFQQMMAGIGPIAAIANQSLEDTVAALAALRDRGLTARFASAQLRAEMFALIAPTDKAKGVMAELGINVRSATGELLPFPVIINQFEKALKGMNDTARDQALKDIFGRGGFRGIAIALQQGSAALEAFSEDLKQSDGRAKQMSETMTTSLGASITSFKNILAKLKFNELFSTPLESIVRGLIELGKTVSNATDKIGGMKDVILTLGTIFLSLPLSIFILSLQQMVAMVIKMSAGFSAGRISAYTLTEALTLLKAANIEAAVGTAILTDAQTLQIQNAKILLATKGVELEALSGTVAGAVSTSAVAASAATKVLGIVGVIIGTVVAALSGYGAWMSMTKNKIEDVTQATKDEADALQKNISAFSSQSASQQLALKSIKDLGEEYRNYIKDQKNYNLTLTNQIETQNKLTTLQNSLKSQYPALTDEIRGLAEGTVKLDKAQNDLANEQKLDFMRQLNSLIADLNQIENSATQQTQDFADALNKMMDDTGMKAQGWFQNVYDSVKGFIMQFAGWKNIFPSMVTPITFKVDDAKFVSQMTKDKIAMEGMSNAWYEAGNAIRTQPIDYVFLKQLLSQFQNDTSQTAMETGASFIDDFYNGINAAQKSKSGSFTLTIDPDELSRPFAEYAARVGEASGVLSYDATGKLHIFADSVEKVNSVFNAMTKVVYPEYAKTMGKFFDTSNSAKMAAANAKGIAALKDQFDKNMLTGVWAIKPKLDAEPLETQWKLEVKTLESMSGIKFNILQTNTDDIVNSAKGILKPFEDVFSRTDLTKSSLEQVGNFSNAVNGLLNNSIKLYNDLDAAQKAYGGNIEKEKADDINALTLVNKKRQETIKLIEDTAKANGFATSDMAGHLDILIQKFTTQKNEIAALRDDESKLTDQQSEEEIAIAKTTSMIDTMRKNMTDFALQQMFSHGISEKMYEDAVKIAFITKDQTSLITMQNTLLKYRSGLNEESVKNYLNATAQLVNEQLTYNAIRNSNDELQIREKLQEKQIEGLDNLIARYKYYTDQETQLKGHVKEINDLETKRATLLEEINADAAKALQNVTDYAKSSQSAVDDFQKLQHSAEELDKTIATGAGPQTLSQQIAEMGMTFQDMLNKDMDHVKAMASQYDDFFKQVDTFNEKYKENGIIPPTNSKEKTDWDAKIKGIQDSIMALQKVPNISKDLQDAITEAQQQIKEGKDIPTVVVNLQTKISDEDRQKILDFATSAFNNSMAYKDFETKLKEALADWKDYVSKVTEEITKLNTEIKKKNQEIVDYNISFARKFYEAGQQWANELYTGFTDSLVTAIMTGEDTFKNLGQNIVKQLLAARLRPFVQQTLGTLFEGMGFDPAKLGMEIELSKTTNPDAIKQQLETIRQTYTTDFNAMIVDVQQGMASFYAKEDKLVRERDDLQKQYTNDTNLLIKAQQDINAEKKKWLDLQDDFAKKEALRTGESIDNIKKKMTNIADEVTKILDIPTTNLNDILTRLENDSNWINKVKEEMNQGNVPVTPQQQQQKQTNAIYDASKKTADAASSLAPVSQSLQESYNQFALGWQGLSEALDMAYKNTKDLVVYTNKPAKSQTSDETNAILQANAEERRKNTLADLGVGNKSVTESSKIIADNTFVLSDNQKQMNDTVKQWLEAIKVTHTQLDAVQKNTAETATASKISADKNTAISNITKSQQYSGMPSAAGAVINFAKLLDTNKGNPLGNILSSLGVKGSKVDWNKSIEGLIGMVGMFQSASFGKTSQGQMFAGFGTSMFGEPLAKALFKNAFDPTTGLAIGIKGAFAGMAGGLIAGFIGSMIGDLFSKNKQTWAEAAAPTVYIGTVNVPGVKDMFVLPSGSLFSSSHMRDSRISNPISIGAIHVNGTADAEETAKRVVNKITNLQVTDYQDRFARGIRLDAVKF